MDIATLRSVLLWCGVVNYALLIVWFVMAVPARSWTLKVWGRFFRLTPEQFDLLNFAGMAFYKVLVLVFNLVPWLVLTLMG